MLNAYVALKGNKFEDEFETLLNDIFCQPVQPNCKLDISKVVQQILLVCHDHRSQWERALEVFDKFQNQPKSSEKPLVKLSSQHYRLIVDICSRNKRSRMASSIMEKAPKSMR